jgi:hypothetical protein
MYIDIYNYNSTKQLFNAILDKITLVGYNKITDDEKRILARYSTCKSEKERDNIIIELKERKKDNELKEKRKEEEIKVRFFKQPKITFKIGDRVKVVDHERKNLSPIHHNYLISTPTFEILNINSSGKLDIGYRNGNKIFYYSSGRFVSDNENSNYSYMFKKNNDEIICDFFEDDLTEDDLGDDYFDESDD